MGFGSFKKKFKKYTGISTSDVVRTAAGVATLGGSEVWRHGYKAYKGSSVEDFINDPTGAKAAAKEQIAALKKAGKIEAAHQLEIQAMRNQIIAETAPFRTQGQTELERLRGQTPGSTEFYKQALERGTESIAEQRATYGLTSSGGTGKRFEELGSNLLLQEELARQQGIGRAAALSQVGYGPGLEALRQEGGAAYRQAQTEAGIGAARAAGKQANRQFWLGAGTQILGAGAGYLMGGPGGAAVGSQMAGGATAGGYGSPYTLQQGTGYNQYLNPYG